MPKMKVIYEPRGKAKEYVPEEHGLAVNLWTGCDNGCTYCYAPNVLHMDKRTFYEKPVAREGIIEKLDHDLQILEEMAPDSTVFMCFTTDPFQPRIPEKDNITWRAIFAFLRHGIKMRILTKSGKYSAQMFTFFEEEHMRRYLDYGTTLVYADDRLCKIYEPNAAPTSERIEVLKQAHELGISTWASLEPVWNPEDTLEIIERIAPFTDVIKIGKLNHHKHAKYIDWAAFGKEAEKLCKKHKTQYVIKEDLRNIMEAENNDG